MRPPIIGCDRRGRPVHPISGGQEMLNVTPSLVEIPLSGGSATEVAIKPTTPYGTLGWWAGVLVVAESQASPGAVQFGETSPDHPALRPDLGGVAQYGVVHVDEDGRKDLDLRPSLT